jgi:hypothetical protein
MVIPITASRRITFSIYAISGGLSRGDDKMGDFCVDHPEGAASRRNSADLTEPITATSGLSFSA